MNKTNNYDLNMCLWKHENKVVFSPRGVPYLCSKCENSKPRKSKPSRKITVHSQLVK